jgi:hypothetical protein
MKKTINILVLSCFIFTLNAQTLDSLDLLKKEWQTAFNQNNLTDAESQYLDKGGIFTQKNIYIKGKGMTTALKRLQKKAAPILHQQRLFLQENSKNKRYFELLSHQTTSGKYYYSIIAWRNINGKWQRELEVLDEKTTKNANDYPKGIDEARQKWIDYSNAHQPKQLVKNVYTKDAIYFNGGKVTKGTSAIAERYSYMKNDKWQIDLTAKCVTMVQPNLAYEIGEYKSTGIGHYILIWKKVGKKWQAVFDFNF